jgi:hypothetical protein
MRADGMGQGPEGAAESETSAPGKEDRKPRPWQRTIARWKSEKEHEPADNYFCLVCHANYEEETLTATHRRVGVGCETCHGISDKHSEDEDSVIPPDIMFPKHHIAPFCMTCHDAPELVKEESHRPLFAAETSPNKKVAAVKRCTDCHGEKHRQKVRTRRWDRETGKLTWSDGVRMMGTNPSEKPREAGDSQR